MEHRNRNTAIALLAAGIYLLLGQWIGFLTVSALIILWFGIHKLRADERRTGYILIVIALIFLLNDHLALVIGIILISLGYYYMKSKSLQQGRDAIQKQSLLQSIKWRQDLWELKSTSQWCLIGEIQMDFSKALVEDNETTIVLQGIIADIDFIIPEDMGVSIEASALFGQVNVGEEKSAGLMNKVIWQSPNFAAAEQKITVNISFVIGDIDIKLL